MDPLERVELQVGSRQFSTSRTTLEQSSFFRRALERHGSSNEALYVDQSGDIFEHVLQYLRTGIFPLLYQKELGHNYQTYSLVRAQAKFFGLDRLETWLRQQRYLEAIKMHTRSEISDDEIYTSTDNAGETDVIVKTIVCPEKTYVCPRQIDDHDDHPELCTERCQRTPPIGGALWHHKWEPMDVVMRRKYVFNDDVCIDYGHWLHKSTGVPKEQGSEL